MTIILVKSVHDPTLRTFAIYNGVHRLFHTSAYIELVGEFYWTFKFQKSSHFTLNTPNLTSYRLRGQHFNISITQFNTTLGFDDPKYTYPYCDFCYYFDLVTIYDELWTNHPDPYDSSESKDLYLRDPCMKYIHRFLAYSFSGCKDAPSVVSKIELYFL